jgi:hypothetical protein
MKDNIYLGSGSLFTPVPSSIWRQMFSHESHDTAAKLDFMSTDHHKIRDFVVKQIPEVGGPITTEYIAESLELNPEDVARIIDELEVKMTFLYRGSPEGVTWAYPVTVDHTPHRVIFDSGLQTFAA